MISRRTFLGAGAAAALLPAAPADSLNGRWQFRTDPQNEGEVQGWHLAGFHGAGWTEVTVPHAFGDYQGVAWYRREFTAPPGAVVRIEFEAVYHSAAVWVNG